MNFPDIPNVEFLGDVHLGRRFIEGVPLDRRGDREAMVWADFQKSLMAHNGDVHIQVGDLFDTFEVPNAVVKRAADIYKKAAKDLSSCVFLVVRGNHDASRNAEKVSSFDLFKDMVAVCQNITVVDTPMVSVHEGQYFGVLPWDPFKSAEEQALSLRNYGRHLSFIVCHCDVKSYGGDNFNVLPVDKLEKMTSIVVTGHDHTKRDLKIGDLTVHVTGSMQPYSHGEDPEHTLYLTMTPKELPLVDVTNKYVRVILSKGDVPPEVPNCLGYKEVKAVEKLDDEEADISVEFEGFDTTTLFQGILKELGVDQSTQSQVLSKFTESLNA